MRKLLAILACKLARLVGKRIGRGSSMPGQIALKTDTDNDARNGQAAD